MNQLEGAKPVEVRIGFVREKLSQFASSETPEREKMLKGVVSFTKENVDKEVMEGLVDEEFQARFEKAIERTLQTPFVITADVSAGLDGRKANPWKGSNTMCAIDSTGKVLAANTVPEKELASYGDLNRYSLIKALCTLHLDKAGKTGNLANIENFRYLIGLGLTPFDDIFAGSSKEAVIDGAENKIFIAGSGCHVENSYLTELLGGANPAQDTLAGVFDGIFSDITANFISDPNQTTAEIPEPKELAQIRISN